MRPFVMGTHQNLEPHIGLACAFKRGGILKASIPMPVYLEPCGMVDQVIRPENRTEHR